VRAALVLYAVTLQPAELLHPGGQPVTQTLEFTQAQQTRTGEHLPTRARRGNIRKPLRDDRRKLTLEPRHLSTQRTPRGDLVRVPATIFDGPAQLAIGE
jgi:hypothetical protein